MMVRFLTTSAFVFVFVVSIFAVSDAALARKPRVVCDGPYQIGGRILDFSFTNICEDIYLARVARDYGVRVSGWKIHNNRNLKVEICQFIGFDIRLNYVCAGLTQ
jgi:hypothetical protein